MILREGVELLRWFSRDKCLAREEATGETFLVRGGIPGERVTIAEHRHAWRTEREVVAVERAAPHRIAPACSHAPACTGCSLLHIDEAAEDDLLRLTITEVLARFAGLDLAPDRIEAIVPTRRGGTRVRARFAARFDGQWLLGLRDAAGNLLPLPDCRANHPAVQRALAAVAALLEPLGDTLALASVEVLLGDTGAAAILDADDHPSLHQLPLPEGLVALGLRTGRGTPPRLLAGAWPRILPVGDEQAGTVIEGWQHPHPTAAATLFDWVADRVGTVPSLLDATSGAGSLTLRLAAQAGRITAVDAAWEAVQALQGAATRLGHSHLEARGGKIETVAPRLLAQGLRFHTTLINPMRASLGPVAMQALADLTEQRLLYLAPAPRAGAEDIGLLVANGWRATAIGFANYHPGTGHAMMAICMERDP